MAVLNGAVFSSTFHLAEDELENTPSRKNGVDEETETRLRIYGCELIQEAGILLKLYVWPSTFSFLWHALAESVLAILSVWLIPNISQAAGDHGDGASHISPFLLSTVVDRIRRELRVDRGAVSCSQDRGDAKEGPGPSERLQQHAPEARSTKTRASRHHNEQIH